MDPLTIQRLGHIRHQEIIAAAEPGDTSPRLFMSWLYHLLARIGQRTRDLTPFRSHTYTTGDTRVQQGSVPGQ